MKIGEAARLADLETSAIRFYEAAGVLPAAERTASGYRTYDQAFVGLLVFVKRLRALGIPLNDVREIVALRTRNEAPCASVRASIAHEAGAIDARIAELQQLRVELERLQSEAATVTDSWPTSCVCHLVVNEQ